MKKLNFAVIGVALILAQPCFAARMSMATPAAGGPQQRMQTFQSMTPAQRQTAMASTKSNMQSKMAGMRTTMQARMGGNTTGTSSTGSTSQ